MVMKSRTILVFIGLLLPATTKPLPLIATALATVGMSIPYLWSSWHTTAKDFVTHQESIRSYYLTVKIKRHVKTLREQSFVETSYPKLIDKALAYAQKEQTEGLRSVFKPGIKVIGRWNIYALGNVVKTTVPKNPTKAKIYWERLEETLTNCFFVSHPLAMHNYPVTYCKKALIGFLAIFLGGLVLLYFATPRRFIFLKKR